MGEIESACVAPCVVLVINDNPYGLMFALRYSCRFFHWHHLNSMCWIQGWMPSRSLLILNIFEMIKKKNGHDSVEAYCNYAEFYT